MIVMPLLYGPNFSFSADGKFQYPPVVIIPNYVTSLTETFDNRKEIKEIAFEEGSTITTFPSGLFEDCSSLQIVHSLPEKLTSMGSYAFNKCYALEDVVLPDNLTNLGTYSFQDCQTLEEINLPNGITVIPIYCFNGCTNLSQINKNSDILTLGNYCFQNCSSLTDDSANSILETATSYGTYSFRYCHGLENIKAKGANSYQFANCDNLQTVEINGNITGTTLGEYAFSNCKKLKEIIFTDSCLYTTFERYVFSDCHSLEKIILPSTLVTLNYDTFENCYSLKEITLPESLTSFGDSCFYNCNNLQKVVLGFNVKTIPYRAFYNCSSLEEINLENIDVLNEGCFQNAFTQINFTVPGNVTTIPKNSFYGCGLTQLILEEGITTLADSSISNCPNLTAVILPNTLTTIEQKVFYQDSALKEIILPNSVTVFNSNQVFDYCTSLEKVTLSNQITTIPNLTFGHCTSLKTLEIPDSVTSLGQGIIGYSGIETLYLGSGITTINDSAFGYANELKDIYFNKVKDSITVPTNKWGVPTPDNVTIHWLTSNWTFSSNADLSQAKIFIEGNEVENLYYESENVGEVNFEAYHPDYLPLSGTITLSPPEEQILDLQFSTINNENISGVLFTVVPQEPGATVKIKYNDVEFATDHVLVAPNTEVTYVVEKSGFRTKIITTIVSEELTIVVPMTQLHHIDVNMQYPYNTEIENTYLANLIDDNNFIVNEDSLSISSGPKSYNVGSGAAYGYIYFETPDYESTLSVTAYSIGENNYDYGAIYLGTAIYQPTNSQVRSGTVDGNGEYLMRQTGTSNSYATYTANLEPSTWYYLNFIHVKDSSGNTGADRLFIKNIQFTTIKEGG